MPCWTRFSFQGSAVGLPWKKKNCQIVSDNVRQVFQLRHRSIKRAKTLGYHCFVYKLRTLKLQKLTFLYRDRKFILICTRLCWSSIFLMARFFFLKNFCLNRLFFNVNSYVSFQNFILFYLFPLLANIELR